MGLKITQRQLRAPGFGPALPWPLWERTSGWNSSLPLYVPALEITKSSRMNTIKLKSIIV